MYKKCEYVLSCSCNNDDADDEVAGCNVVIWLTAITTLHSQLLKSVLKNSWSEKSWDNPGKMLAVESH